jgi:hypothetical protein
MKIDRAELVAVLKKVAPALSQKDLVPIFACFCFSKNSVHAYDDVVCLRFPAKFGITGAVRGEMLLPFLNASRAKEIDIAPGDGTVLIKAGRPKLNTALLPESEFLFQTPTLEKSVAVRVDAAFVEALSKTAISMGREMGKVWQYGVTVVPYAAGYKLYATDTKTITRTVVGDVLGTQLSPVLLPPRFVDLLLLQTKDDIPVKMSIAEGWGEAQFQSGLKLFTRTVSGADSKEYDDLLDQLETKTKKLMVEIPKGFDRCLERAALVTKFSKEPVTRLIADGEKLKFETLSPAGDIDNDFLNCEHAAADVRVLPEMVQRGLPHAARLAIVDECVRLSSKGYIYLVSTSNVASPVVEEDLEREAE